MQTRTLQIELPEQMWKRIDRLAQAAESDTLDQFVTRLLDHVQQGVYRSGAWERHWLEQVVGPDAVDAAYQQDEDPL